MKSEKKEEKESFKSYIISFIFNSLCSLALPVGLSFYFAPEKSMEFFHNTVQDKVDAVTGINWDFIYQFGLAIVNEVPPMLKTEYEVLSVIAVNIPPAISTTIFHLGDLDYRITLSLVSAITIAGWWFPFQELKDWLINVIWGSVCLVSGFLPLDSGMDVLADKEAGMYKMAVTLTSVIVTLAANYLVIITSCWCIEHLYAFLWSKFVGLWKKRETPSTNSGGNLKSSREIAKTEDEKKEEIGEGNKIKKFTAKTEEVDVDGTGKDQDTLTPVENVR